MDAGSKTENPAPRWRAIDEIGIFGTMGATGMPQTSSPTTNPADASDCRHPVRAESRARRLAAVVVSHDDPKAAARLVTAFRRDDPNWFATVDWTILHNGPAPVQETVKALLDPSVCVKNLANRGYGAAINEALRASELPYLLVLNSDLAPEPGCARALERVLDRLEASDGRVGIIGFRLLNPDGSPQGSVGRQITLARFLRGLFHPRATRKYHADPVTAGESVPWVTGAAILLNGRCTRDLGGFDERFFMYYEDVDLCVRAARSGWEVRFEPEVALRHFYPYHARKSNHRLAFLARHGLLVYFHKHRPAWEYQALAWIVAWECRFRVLREWLSKPAAAKRASSGGARQFARLLRAVSVDPTGFRVDPGQLP